MMSNSPATFNGEERKLSEILNLLVLFCRVHIKVLLGPP